MYIRILFSLVFLLFLTPTISHAEKLADDRLNMISAVETQNGTVVFYINLDDNRHVYVYNDNDKSNVKLDIQAYSIKAIITNDGIKLMYTSYSDRDKLYVYDYSYSTDTLIINERVDNFDAIYHNNDVYYAYKPRVTNKTIINNLSNTAFEEFNEGGSFIDLVKVGNQLKVYYMFGKNLHVYENGTTKNVMTANIYRPKTASDINGNVYTLHNGEFSSHPVYLYNHQTKTSKTINKNTSEITAINTSEGLMFFYRVGTEIFKYDVSKDEEELYFTVYARYIEPIYTPDGVKLFYANGNDNDNLYVFRGVPDQVEEVQNFIINYDSLDNKVELYWDTPNDQYYDHVKIYRRNITIDPNSTFDLLTDTTATTYIDDMVTAFNEYEYKIVSVNSFNKQSAGLTLSVTTEKLTDISNLLASIIDDTNIMLTWDNPNTTNYLRTKVYLNNQLIHESNNSSFEIKNLSYNTMYNIKITTVDVSGNESPGVITTIRTNVEPPTILEAPKNFIVNEGNGSISLIWSPVQHNYLQGYNVYINGVLHNTNPITTTHYVIDNLTNGQDYDVMISSVADDGGTYSDEQFTQSILATPDASALPIISMNYSLSALVDSITSMFGSIWLIVAFSVSIPLVIFIAVRIKGLFVT